MLVLIRKERPGADMKPIAVSAVFALLEQVIELKKAARGVVKYPVQDDLEAEGVGRVDQRPQRFVAAQHRVNLVVIVGVVAVVAGRLKHRAKVNGRDAQTLDMTEVLDHAP